MTAQVLGILGGMGPAATVEMYRRITDAVAASVDQDHPRIIIDSHAKIPDRTLAQLHGGEDPTPYLLDSARTLSAAGVDVIAMPCNTAHAYLDTIRESISVPVLDMIGVTVAGIRTGGPIGLLATSGTVAVGLYQQACADDGLELLVPSDAQQTAVMRAIGLVKAGDPEAALPLVRVAMDQLAARGATTVVLGCTELSVAARGHALALPAIDPLDALVTAALDRLGVRHRGRTPQRTP